MEDAACCAMLAMLYHAGNADLLYWGRPGRAGVTECGGRVHATARQTAQRMLRYATGTCREMLAERRSAAGELAAE
eukprot:365490-Chlamydomonas_euryale.AAC.5